MLEKIKQLIQPILNDHDVYLDDIEYVKEKNEWYLRIFIEKNNGHLDMDTCVAVSEAISDMLDQEDLIEDEYYLEVSSPGAEKPLKALEKVQQSIGEYVYIQFKNPTQGMNEVYGTILNVEGTQIELQYMVKNIKKKCNIDYNDIAFIRLAVKF
ncbi:ribosome maturation factor RimP [Massilimicrobiota sp. An134]|uniref:ribosome maturation factor RimP n=1 Tax=Massilimicrobiota sp. An134 TaxID=1965557 RepID=UPI000B36CA0C|nr:ribosome maturation factor RimP [Massilimicrobiota sp. An134]OUQ31175.1 ribosome maturation factor [Massilimicrobiota sp. An134]